MCENIGKAPLHLPLPHVRHCLQVYLVIIKQRLEPLLLLYLHHPVPQDIGNVHEMPRVREHALGQYSQLHSRMVADSR